MNLDVILGILLPFAGTTLGAAMVFFMRKEMKSCRKVCLDLLRVS